MVRDAPRDTCKTNVEAGLVLTHEWVHLMTCTPDETGSALSTLLMWTSNKVHLAEHRIHSGQFHGT